MTEALDDYVPADILELQRILFSYIEGFHNQHRQDSSLDYKSLRRKNTIC